MDFEEFKYLMSGNEKIEEELFKNAQKIRSSIFENKIYLRATIELSNICNNTCFYCGMSKENKKLLRYKIPIEEVFYLIDKISELKIGHIHFVTGEINDDFEYLEKIIEYSIKKKNYTTGVFGILPKEKLKKLKEIGLDRYILKFETSNKEIFEEYKPEISFRDRIEYIKYLKEIGYKVGTGNIIHLPKTTLKDYFNDYLLMQELKPNMASSSLFFPNKFSRLKDYSRGNLNQLLRFIAILRTNLLTPAPVIPISSSFGKDSLDLGIKAGGNLVSIPFTPSCYQEYFSMYYDKNGQRIKRKIDEILKVCEKNQLEICIYE